MKAVTRRALLVISLALVAGGCGAGGGVGLANFPSLGPDLVDLVDLAAPATERWAPATMRSEGFSLLNTALPGSLSQLSLLPRGETDWLAPGKDEGVAGAGWLGQPGRPAAAPSLALALAPGGPGGEGIGGLLAGQAPPEKTYRWLGGGRMGIYVEVGEPYVEEADFGFNFFLGVNLPGERNPVNIILELDWIDTAWSLPDSVMILSASAEIDAYFGRPEEEWARLYFTLGCGWLFPIENIEGTATWRGHSGPGTPAFILGTGLSWPLPGPAQWKFAFDIRYFWLPDYSYMVRNLTTDTWETGGTSGILSITGGLIYVF